MSSIGIALNQGPTVILGGIGCCYVELNCMWITVPLNMLTIVGITESIHCWLIDIVTGTLIIGLS